MKEKIYKNIPSFLQNIMITIFNIKAYKKRYGGDYKEFRNLFLKNRNLSLKELQDVQSKRFKNFINLAKSNSEYYKNLYEEISTPEDLNLIQQLPILQKENLRTHIDEIIIKNENQLEVSKTGGTTGKSLQVKFRHNNLQERFAMLDDFRSRFGYELGKKTAWFSGKSILTQKDAQKKRFWKTDYFHKVRYYSTFHIKEECLKYYIENLIAYKPEFFVGFPSTMYEIAKYGLKHKYNFPQNTIKAIFPTAETLTEEMRLVIEAFFRTKMYNQYASSEGAPFIFECKNGNLHLELQSGVFEVLDENDNPTQSGRLVVTSFTTEATPLIRYDIGDGISLENLEKKCGCGNNNPLVKEILGRIDDFIYSPKNGKINIINIANSIKDVKGIIKFQIIQNEIHKLIFNIIIDPLKYSNKEEKLLLKNWRDRVGNEMNIEINYVNQIEAEKSGKFRVVKNSIKHLIN